MLKNDEKYNIGPDSDKFNPDQNKDHHSYTLKNHYWSDEDLLRARNTRKQHEDCSKPSDYILYGFLQGLYRTFNFITLFDKKDPSPESVKFRLILLESVAGIPPFIMAGYRHFRSLRELSYDGGRIYTHLEEAENERMHLITCMQVFETTKVTKAAVYAGQAVISPVCWFICVLNPRLLNRLVGYLEEIACETYGTILDKLEDPNSKLFKAWNDVPAPPCAINYWHLEKSATWPDTLKRIYADETIHRDVNHIFAKIPIEAPNPLLKNHKINHEMKQTQTSS